VFRDAPVKIYVGASPTGLDPVPAMIVPMRESVVTIPPAPSELVLLCAGEGKAPLLCGTPEPRLAPGELLRGACGARKL
jgi:hypothetical protein